MRNLRLFISILLFITGLNLSLSAQPQFYNYDTDGAANSFPLGIAAGKEVQLLYLAGDFNTPSSAPAGLITSVSFRIYSGYPITNVTYNTMTIALGQSAITTLPAGAYYTGTMTTVYNHASVTITAAGGTWLTIPLDTPFNYDPTQSLIIDFGVCSSNVGSIFPMCFTTLTNNRRNWSAGGCPFVYSGQNNSIYHFGVNIQTGGPPLIVTTAASAVTSATATLNGTVNANNAATAVSFEYGLTTAYGTTVAAVPASVSGTVVTPVLANITGLFPGNTYHFRAKGLNSYGPTNGNDMTFTIPAILPAVITTAASGVNGSSAVLNGTVDAGGASTAVTFEWGLTAAYGSTLPGVPATVTGSGATPVSASLGGLTISTTYHYRVKGVNSVGTSNGNDMTFTTTNCPAPPTPGAITGPTTTCGYSTGKVYSVATIAGATGYTWTVPVGSIITAGNNTNSITITLGNTSGSVTVRGNNACGDGPVSSLAVAVNPSPSPTITGQSAMCVNSGYYTYTTEPNMTGYTWTVSSGGTITFGGGGNQIQVTWNSSGAQSVSVNYTNVSGCSGVTATVLPVTVTGLPGNAGSISGAASVCAGVNGIAYMVAPIQNATAYFWTVPAGVTIVSGDMTNAITVNIAMDASSGSISVYPNNICGNGGISPTLDITVNPIPPVPVITNTGYILYSNAPMGNQWYIEGNMIAGATNPTHDATLSGTGFYWSIVTINGCSSGESNHVMVLSNGIESPSGAGIDIYPVPNNGMFNVSFTGSSKDKYTIKVVNSLGINVFEESDVQANGQKVIDLRPVASGVYTVIFENSANKIVKKIVVK